MKTVPSLRLPVDLFLLTKEEVVDGQGIIRRIPRRRSLLERYWLFLKYGCRIEYDRGNRIWQLGNPALDKRDELIHHKHAEMPLLKAKELWLHLEGILLPIIGGTGEENHHA